VDRLIAVVGLRLRLGIRGITGSRGRLAVLLVSLPVLALVSVTSALVAFGAVRVLERAHPALLLPASSAAAALVGTLWALSPLLAGVAITEAHDLDRLVRCPVSLRTLLAASLLANLSQPVTLAALPPLLAVALALAGPGPALPLVLVPLLLVLLLFVAAGQAVGTILHALSRQRRWNDRLLFAGLGLGVVLSLVPFALVSRGGGTLRRLALSLLEGDVFVLVPFSWGARAAVHAGRGEIAAALAWTGGAALAVGAALGLSLAVARRLYRGEMNLGEGPRSRRGRARLRLPGLVGAVIEKDLRVAWRDPRLKAVVFTSVLGPLILLVLLAQGGVGRIRPGLMLGLASFSGLGTVGANALALERSGLTLLFGFPVDRFLILVGKNLAVVLLRTPTLVALGAATVLTVGWSFVPAVLTVLLLTLVLGASADNYLSILHPIPVPAAGRNPHAASSGTRGLGTALLGLGTTAATLALSSPLAFLGWLPHLLGEPGLWWLTLPLALVGAAAAYFMLTAGAARLLERREPELLARAAGEE
jgi:ABC-2 type transport system permease protein